MIVLFFLFFLHLTEIWEAGTLCSRIREVKDFDEECTSNRIQRLGERQHIKHCHFTTLVRTDLYFFSNLCDKYVWKTSMFLLSTYSEIHDMCYYASSLCLGGLVIYMSWIQSAWTPIQWSLSWETTLCYRLSGLSRWVVFRQGGQKILLIVMPENCTVNYQFVILFKNSSG